MIKLPGMGRYDNMQDEREAADANGEPYVKKSFRESRQWPIFSAECEEAIAGKKAKKKGKGKALIR